MHQYPKWLLALLFPCVIIPIFTMIFYLFGGLRPFGVSTHKVLDILLYLAAQLFWIFPLLCFFLGLFLWGWMREKSSVIVGILGLLVSLYSIGLIIPCL